MAEIRNYTMNFGCGRAARLTLAPLALACAEIHLRHQEAPLGGFDIR